MYKRQDQSTGVIDFYVGNLGNDPFVDPANPTLIADDYFSFGAVDEYRRYSVNLADLVTSGDLLSELSLVETVPVEDNGHRFYLSPVANSTGLRIDSELNLAHQTVAQSGIAFTSPLDVPPSAENEEEESDGTVLTQLAALKTCVQTLQTAVNNLAGTALTAEALNDAIANLGLPNLDQITESIERPDGQLAKTLKEGTRYNFRQTARLGTSNPEMEFEPVQTTGTP